MINESLLIQPTDSNYRINVIVKNETVSTNLDARELIKKGLYHPTLIIAESQTGGRGRQGKSFISPKGGLYFSLCLNVGKAIETVMGVTSCAAVAVCRAIDKTVGVSCGIKWVNDIYLDGGKLCGILVESVNDYEKMVTEHLIIGIGVNTGYAPTADCNYKISALNGMVSREVLCTAITKELIKVIDNDFNFKKYSEEYRRRSIVLGHEVEFNDNGMTCCGIAHEITDSGALSIKCGERFILLQSGEISLRLK